MKTFRYLLSLITIACICSSDLKAQTKSNSLSDLKSYTKLFSEGKINGDLYVSKVDSAVLQFLFRLDGSLPNDSLLLLLEEYRKIAWSDKKYTKFRENYYGHLATNADVLGKGGLAVFYAEKYNDEVKNNDKTSLLSMGMAMNYHVRNKNYKKILELFKKEDTTFKLYEQLLKKSELSKPESKNLIFGYSILGETYLKMDNLQKAEKVLNKLHDLTDVVVNDSRFVLYDKVICKMHYLSLKTKLLLKQKQYSKAEASLNLTEEYLKKHKKELRWHSEQFEREFKMLKANSFLEMGKYMQASQLFEGIERSSLETFYDSLSFNLPNARVSAALGNYKNAYEILNESINFQEEKYTAITSEIDELLYAHAEAETNRRELIEAEIAKKTSQIWVAMIAAALFLVVIVTIILREKEQKKNKANIEQLNKMTEVLIAEAREKAVKEEQRKLGQDLHDDLSGSVAGLLHTIEQAESKSKDKEVSQDLTILYNNTKLIYNTIRNKSHQIYTFSEESEEDHLDENIKQIVDAALPDKLIMREIDIDKSISSKLTTEVRIEILRIIQEAMNNIIKHAKSATEIFVFLHKEHELITLQIGDNGKGKKNISTSKSLGFQSIQNRAKAFGGQFDIHFSRDGTILTINFPSLKH